MSSGTYQKIAAAREPGLHPLPHRPVVLDDRGPRRLERPGRSKIKVLTTAVNRFISDLIGMCERGEDQPRDYFYVGVIAYTTDRSYPPNVLVGPILQGQNGTLSGATW